MRFVVAALVALILLVPLLSVPFSSREAALGSYNGALDGTAHLMQRDGVSLAAAGHPAKLLHGGLANLEPASHGLLVLGGERAFSTDEVSAVRTFLSAGGRALIADDRGSARVFLDDLDLGVSIPGIGFFTPGYSKRPEFPVALSTGVLPSLPAEVVLNEPSIVDGRGDVVLRAPDLSWRDENGNGLPDLEETRGAWAVARLVRVGEGSLLVLGDPSIFTSDMDVVDRAAAEAFLGWLAEDGRLVLVDESHRASADPTRSAVLLAGLAPAWASPAILVGGLLAVALVTLKPWARRVRAARRSPRGPRLTAAEKAALAELDVASP